MPNPFLFAESVADVDDEINTSLPLYKEYAYDYDNNCLIYDGSKNKVLTENEALKVWIYKALQVERYKYLIYDSDYGVELEPYIGRRANDVRSANEIKSHIIQALSVNPYIKSIDKVTIKIDGDKLTYEIYATTIYGKLYDTHKI